MGTYTQILYQIVFHTYKWEPTLDKDNRARLFSFISGILKHKKCFVYQIGGTEDHIHIITHLHPDIALSNLVKDIKLSTIQFIKNEKLFLNFKGWGKGYGAFTYDIHSVQNLSKYVSNQEEHHKEVSSRKEYVNSLKALKIDFDEKYL